MSLKKVCESIVLTAKVIIAVFIILIFLIIMIAIYIGG